MDKRSAEDYTNLPYTIEVVRDNDPENRGWVASVAELPGCITQAESFEELGEMIEDAMSAWIEVALTDGLSIPEPRPLEAYSGKFVVRVPKSLHRELVEAADHDGVSLNSFVNTSLATVIGGRNLRISPSERYNLEDIADEYHQVLMRYIRETTENKTSDGEPENKE
jgi:antitoxin HicB